MHRQRTFALTPSQIKHVSTCNEFHHNTDQFKTPPQTNRSRLQKCKQMSAVKMKRQQARSVTLELPRELIFFEIKRKAAGGGVFSV